jgi:hypothetical protein
MRCATRSIRRSTASNLLPPHVFQQAHATLPFIGSLLQGERNAITDVAGVTVGHQTLSDGGVQTGVTVIRPHAGDPFRDKVPAAAVVLNGFGKSVGLVQLEELGVLETPIALTNTFSVGTVATAQIRDCVARNPETGRALPTVNPLVFECNDGYLNDIQRLAVTEADYLQALQAPAPISRRARSARGAGCRAFSSRAASAAHRAACRRSLAACVHTVGAWCWPTTAASRSWCWPATRWATGAALASRSAAWRRARRCPGARKRLDHHRGGHRRPARRAPAAPPGAARGRRPGAHGLGLRPWQRRHRAGFFHRLHRARPRRAADARRGDAARRAARRPVPGRGRQHRAGDSSCAVARHARDRPRRQPPAALADCCRRLPFSPDTGARVPHESPDLHRHRRRRRRLPPRAGAPGQPRVRARAPADDARGQRGHCRRLRRGRHRGAGERLARRLSQHAARRARCARPRGAGQAALPEHGGRRGRRRGRRLHGGLPLARPGPRHPWRTPSTALPSPASR